jgi:hypothetical protein
MGLVMHRCNFTGKEKGEHTQWIGFHDVEDTFKLAGR